MLACSNCTGYGMTLATDRDEYFWNDMDERIALPYICQLDCPIGYTWYHKAKMCLKIKAEQV